MLVGQRQQINIPPGVNKDDTSYSSFIYTDAQGVRFYNGLPQMIGGNSEASFENAQILDNSPRSIFSYVDNSGVKHTLIGTSTRLYTYEVGSLYNITPLVTATTSIPNSLSSNYKTIGSNALSSVLGSNVVTLVYSTFTELMFQTGDIISISGATAFGGFSTGDLNASHQISSITPTTISFSVSPNATSSATGGGGSIVLSTRLITVAQTAHGFLEGDRVKILGAANTGGFLAVDINIENVIRNVSTNAYTYYLAQTENFATSAVTSGGGSGTTVQGQIVEGNCTFSTGLGYGGGPYSIGAYGTPKAFTAGYSTPRIWSIDRYGNGVVLTPGDQGGLYEWAGTPATAPTLVDNAPAAINYVFVANNEVVTFGAGTDNTIMTSDTLDNTQWTPGPTTNAYTGQIIGTGRLIAHSYINNQYLIFTETSVYSMTYIGKPEIWLVTLITQADGIISPKAVTQTDGAVMWVGHKDLWIYNGSVISQVPNNTLKLWFYDTLNVGKYYLTFCRKIVGFNEMWIHFPGNDSSEPDTYVIWNYAEGHFTNGMLSRTAAEESQNALPTMWLANGSCDGSVPANIYLHEVGFSDNGSNLVGTLLSNYVQISEGDYLQQITRIIPSTVLLPIGTPNNNQSLYSITVYTKEYDGDATFETYGPYPVAAQTSKIETRIVGRQRQYEIDFNTQNGFRMQRIFEEVKPSTVR
jgi:hypothetical protein